MMSKLEDIIVDMKDSVASLEGPLGSLEQRIEQFSTRSSRSFEKGFINSLKKGKFEFQSFKTSALNALSSVADAMLNQAVSGISASVGGMAIGMFGKAGGGTVSAGVPTLVGERGPEIFIPRTTGSVNPNIGGGALGNITVNNTINLSTGVLQTVKAELMQAMPTIEARTQASVIRAIDRGGVFARKVGMKG